MYLSHAHASDEIMKCSPGFLIRCIAIERGIAEDINVYDFLRGNESYKYEEFKCVPSKNWLMMASSATPGGKVRFWMFVTRELWLKSAVRLHREYFELKRFMITKHPSLPKIIRFITTRLTLILGLGVRYIGRFSSPTARASSPQRSSAESINDAEM